MSPSPSQVMDRSRAVADWIIDLRRHFHQYPELSDEEEKTAAKVVEVLQGLGVETRYPVGGHGVVGIIRGDGSRVVGLRADMDALPITEENDVEYRSRVPGVMHACGHDTHTAMLLGVARLAAEIKAQGQLPGTVCLYFQPAEEAVGGAERMIAAGALDPRPQYVIAQHAWPDLPVGSLAVSPGPVTAAVDACDIEIRGFGGHGAAPHQTHDPVVAACQVVSALQTVVSRHLPPQDPGVVTVGSIHGGTKANIIPPSVKLEVTVRNSTEANRKTVEETIRRIANGTARAHGCEAMVDYRRGYPPIVNDEGVTARVRALAEELLGEGRVHPSPMTMGGEDFSFFAQEIPGCFYRLGVSNPDKGFTGPVHNPRFDIDEDALWIGTGVMTAAALRFLEEG